MSEIQQLPTESVKDILQLYSNIMRLEVLRKKAQKQREIANIKNELMMVEESQDINKQNMVLRECMSEMIDIYNEVNNNMNLYQATLDKIIRVFERKMFSQEEYDEDEGAVYVKE